MLRLFNRPSATPSPRPRHPQPQLEPLETRRMLSATVEQVKSETFAAFFEQQDGPILTNISIVANKVIEAIPGGTIVEHTSVDLSLAISNIVEGFSILVSENVAAPAHFWVSPDLSAAHADGAMPMVDVGGLSFTGTYNLDFVATDKISAFAFADADRTFAHTIRGRARDAIATGMISFTGHQVEPDFVFNVTSFFGVIQKLDNTTAFNAGSRAGAATTGSAPTQRLAKDLFSQTPVLN